MRLPNILRSSKTWLLLLMGLALGMRVWRYFSADLMRDTAICGLMGLSVRRGDFLLFFFGQRFMGTLDAYLSAPLYLLFGASVLTAHIIPVLFSMAVVAGIVFFLRQSFGTPGRMTGLLFLAVPTSISLYWVTEGKPFYHLAMFLSVLLLGLTRHLSRHRDQRSVIPFLAWGFLTGILFWVNFLFGVVIAANALFLALTFRKHLLWRPLAGAVAGGIGGFTPLLILLLGVGHPNLGIVPPGARFTWLDRLQAIFFNSLPIVLGINPRVHGTTLSLTAVDNLIFFLLLGLMIWAAVGLSIRGLKADQPELLLPILIIGFNFGACLVGGRPVDYNGQDQRYFTPLYLSLPFLWGYIGDRVRQWPILLGGLAVLLLGVHVAGYGTYRSEESGPLLRVKNWYCFTQEKKVREQIDLMRANRIHTLYIEDYDLAFLADWRPRVAAPLQYEDYKAAAQVDGSLAPAFWEIPAGGLELLGLRHRVLANGIRHGFALPSGSERLLDPSRWQVFSLDGRPLGKNLTDGDLNTFYHTHGSNPDGQGFTIDLDREELVGGMALIPSDYRQVPAGLRIEAAGSDGAFRLIREARNYFGPAYLSGPHPFIAVRYPRIEAYFPPQALRYLRLTQLGQIAPDWSVNEVLLFGPGHQAPALPWPPAAEALLKTVSGRRLNRLFADAWPSALLYSRSTRRPQLLLPNQNTDMFGSKEPLACEPLVFDPLPGNGLLIFNRETTMVAKRLVASGFDFKTIPAGNYTLFEMRGRRDGPPLPVERIVSDLNPGEARRLRAGLPPGERWSTGTPQRPGMRLIVDLGKISPIQSLRLSCPRFPLDFPRGLEASFSADGLHWKTAELRLAEPLVFTGQVLLEWRGPDLRYRFDPPLPARYLRLTLTESDPVYWWSVESIQLRGPQGPGS